MFFFLALIFTSFSFSLVIGIGPFCFFIHLVRYSITQGHRIGRACAKHSIARRNRLKALPWWKCTLIE